MSARGDHKIQGFRIFAETLSAVTHPILKRKGRIGTTLLAHWRDIVGPQLAASVWPEKLSSARGRESGGVLVLRLRTSALATEIQHAAPVILERVNSVFGYRAATRLVLLHGQAGIAPAAAPAAPLPGPQAVSAAEESALQHHLADVRDPALQRSLLALGRALASAPPERQ